MYSAISGGYVCRLSVSLILLFRGTSFVAKIFCQFDAVNDPTGLSVYSKRRCLNILRDVSLFSWGGRATILGGEGS